MRLGRTPIVWALLASSCGGTPARLHSTAPAAAPPARVVAPPEQHRAVDPVPVAVEVDNPVTRGELPWWHALKDGIYRVQDDIVVFGVGISANHHHVAEGFMQSKVSARLGVRKAAELIRFSGTIPEPTMMDLFITRERRFFALYMIRVPKDAGVPANISTLSPPDILRMAGRRRVGRHIYEGERHLYLECDVEGPIANPDWGRTRASARG